MEKVKKNTEKKARKPGRPRKNPLKKPRPRNGITNTPISSQNSIELLYDKPLVMKKTLQFFKLMAVSKVQLWFRKKEVILWALDHHKKNRILISINVNNLNHYYCEEELDIGLICRNLELVLTKIDKTYTSVVIISRKGYAQKHITIILKNDIEIDEEHRIELVGDYSRLENRQVFDNYNSTINFNLPGRYFKKMVTDIKSFSDIMSICQNEKNENVIFEYINRNKKIKSTNIIRNNKIIKLISNIKEDESFRVSFVVDYIKPISASFLSEVIEISISERNPLKFTIKIDNNTIIINVLTEIIDERINNI